MADGVPGRPAGWRLLSVGVVSLALVCAALSAGAAVLQSSGNSRTAAPASTCTAYVVNAFSDSVTPIPTSTNRAGRPIPAGRLPIAIAVTPDGSRAYVVDEGSPGTVTPIRTASNRAGRPIRVGGTPEGIVMTPDGATAYVVLANGHVVPIRTATDRPGAPIGTSAAHPGGPYWLALTPDGRTLYVADEANDTVTPISTATGMAGQPIRVGRSPVAMAVTPNGKTLYVVNADSGTVTPIHTTTNTAGHQIRVGIGAVSIAVRPAGGSAYVINPLAGTVTRIKTASNTAGSPVRVGRGPALMAITPNGEKAYVLHPDVRGSRKLLRMVTPLRLGTSKGTKPISVGEPFKVGAGPIAIAITPDGQTAYIASARAGTVTPVRTATNVAGTPIRTAMQPNAIAVACRADATRPS